MTNELGIDDNDEAHQSPDPDGGTTSGAPSNPVGYGSPPARTRFKKGRSGNRRGRPVGSRSLAKLFDEVLGETIAVREGGRSRRISKAEALAKVALNGAVKGDPRAANAFILLAQKTGMLDPPKEADSARHGYLVVPPVATPEEWQKEALEALAGRTMPEEQAAIRKQKKFKICKTVEGEIIRRPVD